jgi:hypothetical protein
MSYRKWKRIGSKSDSVSSGPKIAAHSWIEKERDRRTFQRMSVTIQSWSCLSFDVQYSPPSVFSTAGKLKAQ